MGLFRKKEKEYTLNEAIKMLQEEGFENYIAIPTKPEDILNTKYKLKLDEKLLKQVPHVETPFQENRRKMLEEIGVDEKCKQRMNHIIKSDKIIQTGKEFNNWQGAEKYNHGKQYGQYR